MDSSPAALFDSYDQDFQQIIQSIREKLDGEANDQRAGKLIGLSLYPGLVLNWCLGLEQRKATLRRVEMELDEADEMVCRYLLEVPMTRSEMLTGDIRYRKWRLKYRVYLNP
jgi:vesicle transport through interaction with t-SNAREs 1